jgi:hypothetical protein
MKSSSRLRAALVRLFWLPEHLYRLPPEHPHRFFAAQVILYVGVGVILVVASVLRAHGADLPSAAGFVPPASVFTEHLQTEYGHERDYERYLAGPDKQSQEEGKKQGLGMLFTDSIPLHLDGIPCHALFVLTLLLSVMP